MSVGGHNGADRPRIMGVETRTRPVRRLQKTHGGVGGASVSTAQVTCLASGFGSCGLPSQVTPSSTLKSSDSVK